jgi:ParB-like chromosome segregation protein Spo0J
MPDTRTIALSCIVVAKRRLRALREETVNALVQSMAVQGQLQPIIVRRDTGGGYWLVAGLHRFDAAQKLKWGEINCTVFDDMDADQAELAEIDENLIRADLTPAEEAVHIGRRKELYEKVHPETMHGAVGRRGKRSQNATSFEPVDAFIDDTAKKTGKHRATIARKAARAKKVPVLPDIVGTSLDEGAQIDALAKLPVEKQRSLAEAAKRGEKVSAITARGACDPAIATPGACDPAIATPGACDLHDQKMSDRTGKARSRDRQADRAPTLDPRAWSMSTPQEREAFVKAVGRHDIDDIINALQPSRGFDTLKQAWNAATLTEQIAFATEYYDELSALGWTKKWR